MRLRILVAPDKFKHSLGAAQVAAEIGNGLRDVLPEAEIILRPVADGGEGTAEAICRATGGEWQEVQTHDAFGHMITSRFAVIGERAVFEMSAVAGLSARRDPTCATTFGVGQMLLAAAQSGASEIIIGLGGSGTNDGGFGFARALGFRFFDAANEELTERVTDLARLDRIEKPAGPSLPQIVGACDVRNHLLGQEGATRIYGPQKGATPEEIEQLECSMQRLVEIAHRDLHRDFSRRNGAGAAGGLGFGLMTFGDAELRPGFEVVAEMIGLEDTIRVADIAVTGEGKLDAQTLAGKAPAGVAALARKHGKPVFAIGGSAETQARSLFDAVLTLVSEEVSVADAMADTADLLRQRARELARLVLLPKGGR